MTWKSKSKPTTRLFVAALGAGALLVAAGCSGNTGTLTLGGDDGAGTGDPGSGTGGDGAGPACTDTGLAYRGFADTDLNAGRGDGAIGADRGRLKPFSALSGEYSRVIGAVPASLTGTGATFGQPPARFYQEPASSAVSLYTAFSVAFDGCLTTTAGDAKYAAAPTAETATAECSAWSRKFWSRAASPDDLKACVDAATVQTAKEPDARRRWAYTCAGVLTSAGFLTY